jgi:hypothetical protein
MLEHDATYAVPEEAAVQIATKIQSAILTQRAKTRGAAPAFKDPLQELHSLIQDHVQRTKKAVALHNMAADRTSRTTGEKTPCRLPKDTQAEVLLVSQHIARTADAVVPNIKKALVQIPIYHEFFKHVCGFGPGVVTGYMVSEINIGFVNKVGRGLRPSGLRRYCGFALHERRDERKTSPHYGTVRPLLERLTAGQKRSYNPELRTRIWQGFQAMRQNAGKCTMCAAHREEYKALPADASKADFHASRIGCLECMKTKYPFGRTNKYLDIWYNAKHGAVASGMTTGADSKGRNKAIDAFLLDLYTIWRTLEGLEVWSSYYEHKIGEGHRGWHLIEKNIRSMAQGRPDAPCLLTLEEAKALTGDISLRPLAVPRSWTITP